MKFAEINKVLGDFMLNSDKETVVTCVVNGYQQVSYLWRTSATFSIDYDDSVVFVAAKVLSIQDSNFFPDEETRNFFEEASVKVCSSELTDIFLDLQLFDLTRQAEHPYIPMLEKFLEFNELDKVFETFQARLSELGIKDPIELFHMRKTGNGMVYWEVELSNKNVERKALEKLRLKCGILLVGGFLLFPVSYSSPTILSFFGIQFNIWWFFVSFFLFFGAVGLILLVLLVLIKAKQN